MRIDNGKLVIRAFSFQHNPDESLSSAAHCHFHEHSEGEIEMSSLPEIAIVLIQFSKAFVSVSGK